MNFSLFGNYRSRLLWAGFILILFYTQILSAQTAAPRAENQLWFDGQYSIPLNKRTELTGSGSFRLGRGNFNHIVFELVAANCNIKLLPYLAVAPNFTYVASQAVAGKDVREQRYAGDVILSQSFHGFSFSDRNRFERRVILPTSYYRYMNRLRIEHPATIAHQQLKLWIAEEAFYYSNRDAWTRNRLSAGVTRRMTQKLAMDFYYLRQNDHYSRPGDLNAFGVAFKFSK